MADGAVNFLLDKLTTVLLQKASLLGNAHKEIEEIKLELESMKSFLQDAERRKEKSDSVETWVRQVREVAYDVEDIIDELMHQKYKEHLNKGVKGIMHDFVNFPKNMTARYQMAGKVQKIKAKVHEVSERSKRYGFDKLNETTSRNLSGDRWQQYGESSSFLDEEDEVVGMEESTDRLLGWLTDDEPRRTVISIVGMGGLGKTTLVTRVYNNHIIKPHFDCWAWISVSQKYGVGELLRSMIKELVGATQVQLPGHLGSMNYRQLVTFLADYLHQKRYIIVLDDVWSIELWSQIRVAFPNNKNGSRIILTTRNQNVAVAVGSRNHVHHLQPLKDKVAWYLLCKKAFCDDPDYCCPEELRPLAEDILKKCEGLPLAIVAVGGLMCSRSKTIVDWKNVHESLNWQLSNNPRLERVKGILLLSFNDLPFYLKHCFLYCCVFRNGYPIKRKKLIRLWVAEGFIRDRKGMTLEEVAEEYLSELILRNMIQVTEANDAGRVKLCRVHDVMRELAMTTSEKENFCAAYDGSQSMLEAKIHHLSVYDTGEGIRLSSSTLCHLRSFFVFPTDMCSSFSFNTMPSKFRLLRVLNLEGVPVETTPRTLMELFNLRYLNLKDTKIRELSSSIEMLYNLQTLDLRNTYLERLPSGISKLFKLRHLCVCCKHNNQSETTNISCGMQVPIGICHIRSLQTLACIIAETEIIQHIGNLIYLKRLKITKLRASDGPKLCASIQRMKGLLHLGVIANDAEELHLEALSQPPLFLQKLTLVGQLRRLPPWLGSLTSLTHLHLGCSCLQEEILSSIHVLSRLVLLELNNTYNGTLLCFRSGWFPRLTKLKILELKRLENIKFEEASLPSIRELNLVRCQVLKELPHGIEHLTTLQKLHVEETLEEFAKQLQSGNGEVEEKVQHISMINNGEARISSRGGRL